VTEHTVQLQCAGQSSQAVQEPQASRAQNHYATRSQAQEYSE
jgi:hypothetical protein